LASPMDEQRKNLLTAGICLGDITLAMAAVAGSLPLYVAGLDTGRLLAGCSDVDAVRQEIDSELAGEPSAGTLPPGILRTLADRAILSGRFLSAIRCLEMLGEKDAYIERRLEEARKQAADGKMPEAARALVAASNLDLADGIPAFQYAGPDLHDACIRDPGNCITRVERENAVLRAFKYLLPNERVHQVVSDLPSNAREDLLAHVVLERDPEFRIFLASFEKAQRDLEEAREKALAELVVLVKRVEGEVRKFADALGKISVDGEQQKETVDRARLTTLGLSRELVGLETLVRDQQFHRLARRLEQLLESREQMDEASGILGTRGGASENIFTPLLALIAEMTDRKILDEVQTIEDRLLSAQVTMLGRKVHSHEHWQYLRELAFKYPASPLMCCLSKINDRWMVVPMWESPVAEILRSHAV
jgi:hypothetical protein